MKKDTRNDAPGVEAELDESFDAAFASLGGIEPPETLSRRTLLAVEAERRAGRRRSFLSGFGVATAMATAMAAGMMFFLQTDFLQTDLLQTGPPAVGDPGNLVPRGAVGEEGLGDGTVDLRVVVERAGAVERFAEGRSYAAGDVLRFRVDTPTAGTARLKRNGVELHRMEVPAGESDLSVGYALEAGEKAAMFSVEIGGREAGVRVPAVTSLEVTP